MVAGNAINQNYTITVLLNCGIFGEYYSNYKNYGKLFVYNTPLGLLPHFYKDTTFICPVVQSIIGGYFTFRIIDMIENQIITNSKTSYPINRTSVWSQLYGRTNFLYFNDWPAGIWQKTDPTILAVGRVALVLALLPTLLFLLGLNKDMKIWGIAFIKNKYEFLKKDDGWIFHVFFIGFISFIILFTLKGRDFSFMKIIYLFPGLLAITIPLLKGFELAHNFIRNKKIAYAVFNTPLLFYGFPI